MSYRKLKLVLSLLMSLVLAAYAAPAYANAGLSMSPDSEANSLLFPAYPHTDGNMSIAGFKRDSQGKSHVLYQQQYKGVPVYGKYAYIHKNAANQIYAASDKFDDALANLELDVTPILTADEAIAALQLFLKDHHGQPVQFGTGDEAFPLDPPTAELIVYPQDGRYYLAYQVEADYIVPAVGSWVAFVDARDGRIIHTINKVRHAVTPVVGSGTGTYGVLPLQVSQDDTDGQYYMLDSTREMYDGEPVDLDRYLDISTGVVEEQGLVITMDYASLLEKYDNASYKLKPVSSASRDGFADLHAVDAHYWTGEVYEFYREKFGRNSIDGEGMDLHSFVHYTEAAPNNPNIELPVDNAFWAFGAMWYGDGGTGSRAQFDCLSCANDIVAHELTHGVIEYTANLQYENQPGALNESIADIMAVVFDADDWTIGEDASSVPIRDLANPHNGNQPMHMDEYMYLPNTYEGDYGGVHYNSGIPNHAAYLMATRMEDAGYDGRYLLGQITYEALTNYLHPASDFMDARLAFQEAVAHLTLSAEAKTEIKQIVKDAWEAVGVTLSPDSYMTMYDHYYNEAYGAFPFYFNTSVTASVYYADITVSEGDVAIPIEKSIAGDILRIQPTVPLTHSVTYDVYVPAGAFTDRQGDLLSDSATVSFTVDKEAPSWPSNALTASNIKKSEFTIAWPHVVDDFELAGYEVYLNGQFLNFFSPDVTKITLLRLQENTDYTVRVFAYDAAGNAMSRTKTVKTLSNFSGGGFFGGGGWGPPPAEEKEETDLNGETVITVKPDERKLREAIAGEDAVIAVDAKAENRVDTMIVELPADLVKQANAKQKAWRIETNEATFTFEPGFVTDSQLNGNLVFTVDDVTADGALNKKPEGTSALSPVYDLQLEINERIITSFQKPVEISMNVRAQTSELHKLGAYYYNERQGAWEYIGGKLGANGRIITFETDHFSQYTVMAYHKIFKDVQGHWAQADIEAMAARHIAQGVTADSFAPNTPITRAEFTALLVRTLQLEAQSDKLFTDVPAASWYAESVNKAYTAGIVNGMDENRFAPGSRITREQMAVMIVQAYAKANLVDAASLLSARSVQFPDMDAASEWAQPAIGAAVSLNLVSGRTDGSFDPKANASRAEAIAMIKRLMDKIE